MPLGLKSWRHGGVIYPLNAETTNSLLVDADPALHYALDLFATVIQEYIGERLLAEAALVDLNFPSAVEKRLHFEPSPFLQAHDMVFPLFCLYRSEETWDRHAHAYEKDSSVWSWAYVLPPLTPQQIERLDPILRSVAVVVSSFAMQSFDPNWEAGKTLRDLSGIQQMAAGPVRYMDLEMLDGGQNEWWRGVSGKLLVQERSSIVLEGLDMFEGANVDIDLAAPEGTIDAFVEIDTQLPPVLATVQPSSGTKAGSVYFEVIGTGFRIGTPVKILVGGSYAGSAQVASPFKVTGLTPEHEAHPTYAADVQVIDCDGQASNVLAGAYTFLTP
jgi:hypothetical protein